MTAWLLPGQSGEEKALLCLLNQSREIASVAFHLPQEWATAFELRSGKPSPIDPQKEQPLPPGEILIFLLSAEKNDAF